MNPATAAERGRCRGDLVDLDSGQMRRCATCACASTTGLRGRYGHGDRRHSGRRGKLLRRRRRVSVDERSLRARAGRLGRSHERRSALAASSLIKSVIVLFVVITTFAYAMLFERKIMGWMQLRPGPNRVGPWGMLQPAADAAKMLFKEDLTPEDGRSADLSARAVHLARLRRWARSRSFRSRSRGRTCGASATSTPAFCSSSRSRRSASTAFRWQAGPRARSIPLLGSIRSTAQMISLRAGDDDVGRRRADPRRHDLAGRHRARADTGCGSSSRSSSASSSTSSRPSPKPTARRSIWSKPKPNWSAASTRNIRACASGCSSSPST